MTELVPWRDFGVTLRILETHYLLKPAYDGTTWLGWRLHKADGTKYDILKHRQGDREWWECSCPDFGFRHDHNDTPGCKHLFSLRSIGLLY